MPEGPWVLVVGMHRSGTSAVAGALGHLGLAVPVDEDRWEGSEVNPEYWESRAIGTYDDALLARLGGSWDRPPALDHEWETDLGLAIDELGGPAVPASVAFPNSGPVVWKDPRSCLLLRHWLVHLPKPVAAVFIWRSPLSVARSIRSRDGLHLADGVALWERYNRSGLSSLVGVDTFVIAYESIVEDSLAKLGELARWLGDLPQFAAYAPHWDLAKASASISPQLRRQQTSGESELLLGEHRQLVEHLNSVDGPHRPLTSPPPGDESPWTSAVLGDRNQLSWLALQRDALAHTVRVQEAAAVRMTGKLASVRGDLEVARGEVAVAQGETEQMRSHLERTVSELAGMYELNQRIEASTSWRVTRPLRRVAALRHRKVDDPPGD